MSHCCFRFRSLEIYKNVGLPLSTTAFTVKDHADNLFYKYTFLFQIYSTISVFYQNTRSGFLPLLFFPIKTMVYKKRLFIEKNSLSVDYAKIIENMLYTHYVTCNLSRRKNKDNDIYKKDQ